MPFDWSNATNCMLTLTTAWEQAESYIDDATEHADTITWYFDYIDDVYIRSALGHARDGIKDISLAVGKILNVSEIHSPRFNIAFYAEYYGGGESAAITWKDIIAAWSGISDAARMWTITGIDQMRQNIWNKNPEIKWTENPFE